MSQGRSSPVATKKVAKSKRKSKARKYKIQEENRVFAKPEYRLPFRLAALTNSPGRHRAIQPAPWLLAAVESGLVEMVAPTEDSLKGGYLSPIGRHKPPRMERAALEKLLAEGIANTLIELENLGKEPDEEAK